MIVVAAPDKFRGTADAVAVAAAISAGADAVGAECRVVPMADGGEGTLEALGGANQETVVSGPLGHPVPAQWRLDADGVAVIESARACGLILAGGAEGNDPIAATTQGVGELIVDAVRHGARQVLVGVGGSATTDGGQGAADVIEAAGIRVGRDGVQVRVCCDVTTPFTDAARVFAPQKGADEQQIDELTQRLVRRRDEVLRTTGTDLDAIAGSGAAGGLAGGLAALGAELVPGFDAIAELVGLDRALAGATVAITGEGRVDATSGQGKVVGGVIERARRAGARTLVVGGQVAAGIGWPDVELVDLSATFGARRSFDETADCVRTAVRRYLAERVTGWTG